MYPHSQHIFHILICTVALIMLRFSINCLQLQFNKTGKEGEEI
jgi:hypothetical protein